MKQLDIKIGMLKEYDRIIDELSGKRDALREEIFQIIQDENFDQYKNEFATVSQAVRKTVKIADPESILKKLEKEKLVKYFDVIPEQVIPEHKELNKQFQDDVKSGVFEIEGVEVEEKKFPQIRFVKDEE
jgi:hypothetical protein